MKILFTDDGWHDYRHWLDTDLGVLAKVTALIEHCRRDPFRGIGKPEPLRNELRGWWSRRIDKEHRLIYRVEGKGADQRLEIAQCRFHYE